MKPEEMYVSVAFGHVVQIDVRVTDTDDKSNLTRDPAKVLEVHEKEKKNKYLRHALSNVVISLRSWSPPMVL
jgi:hypothetical protein